MAAKRNLVQFTQREQERPRLSLVGRASRLRHDGVSWTCNALTGDQDEWRNLLINASRRGRSSSLTAVNFIANPLPSSARRTTASALICPSWTRNSSLAVEPTPLGFGVSTNRPPRLKFRTREMSSRPMHRQSTHTCSCVSTREVNLLEWKTICCNKCHHRLRAFQRWRNAEVRRT